MSNGASFFLLEKLGAVTGVSNLHIYAAMRGGTSKGPFFLAADLPASPEERDALLNIRPVGLKSISMPTAACPFQ